MAKRFKSFLSKFFAAKPDSLYSSQALETFKFDNIDFGTEKGKKQLYTVFRRYPVMFRALLTRSYLGVPSVKINCKTSEAQDVVDKFLANLHPVSGELYLTVFLRDVWLNADAFGTACIDPIWDKKQQMFLGLKKIHPISMDLMRESGASDSVKIDKNGNPEGWIQQIGNNKKELDFEDVAYLSFNTIGDEILGISTLEPLYKTAWRLMNIEEGIATAIFRHGFPLYDIQVAGATEGRPPTKEQLDNAASQVKGLNYKSEFIHPPNYKVKLLEAFSLGKGDDYVSSFLDLISSGTGIPKFMLMGSSKELSRANAGPFLKTIPTALNPNRDRLKLFFEEQILWPLMKANHVKECPTLEFGAFPITIEELSDYMLESGSTKTGSLPTGTQDPSKISKTKSKRKKKKEEIKSLPGLCLNEPHGELILKGDKKQIIKSEKEMNLLKKYIGKELYLISGKKIYGTIKLREPHKIGINDFIQLRYAHQVTDEERKEWWPSEKNLYAYEFDLLLYSKQKKFESNESTDVLIEKINPEEIK